MNNFLTTKINSKSKIFFYASVLFFLVYRISMLVFLWNGKKIPYITDAGNYIYRIGLLLSPHNINALGDKSFIYILLQTLIKNIFNLPTIDVFKYFTFLGPFITVLILIFFFKNLFQIMNKSFNYQIVGLFFVMLSFYLMIGGVAATFYYPSYYMMLLSLLLFSTLSSWFKINLSNLWWKTILLLGFMLSIIYTHAAGYSVLAVSLFLFTVAYLLQLILENKFNKKITHPIAHLIVVAKGVLLPIILFVFLLYSLYYIQEKSHLITLTNNSSHSLYAYEGMFQDKVLQQNKPYLVRLHEVFFEYFWPNHYIGPFICLALFLLFANSLRRKERTLIKEPFVYVPLIGWLILFLGITYFHTRAERLFEFVYPWLILLIASSIIDFIRTATEKFKFKKMLTTYLLTSVILTPLVLGIFTINLFVIWRENLKFKNLNLLPNSIVNEWQKPQPLNTSQLNANVTGDIIFFEYDHLLIYLRMHEIFSGRLNTNPQIIMNIINDDNKSLFNHYYIEWKDESWRNTEKNHPKLYRFLASKLSSFQKINFDNSYYQVDGFQAYLKNKNLKPIYQNDYLEIYNLGSFIDKNLYSLKPRR